MNNFKAGVFCCFFMCTGMLLVGAPSKAVKKKAVSDKELFVLLDRAVARPKVSPAIILKNGVSIRQAIKDLGKKKQLDVLVGKNKDQTFLKNILKRRPFNFALAELFLLAGARPEVPVSSHVVKSSGFQWRHYLDYLLAIGRLNRDVVEASFSPDLRTKVFPDGFNSAVMMFNSLTALPINTEKRRMLKVLAFFINRWAEEEDRVFDAGVYAPSVAERSRSGDFKDHIILGDYLKKHRHADLQDVIPMLGKTVDEVIEGLFTSGQIGKPCYSEWGKARPGLLHLAFRSGAGSSLIDRLVECKALVEYRLSKASPPTHALLTLLSSNPGNAFIRSVFDSSAQRKYFFKDDPAFARKLLGGWRKKKYGPMVSKKLDFFETCITSWEKDSNVENKESDEFLTDASGVLPMDFDSEEKAQPVEEPPVFDDQEDFAVALDGVVAAAERNALDPLLEQYDTIVVNNSEKKYEADAPAGFDFSKINRALLAPDGMWVF